MSKGLKALERLKNHTISYVGSDYKVSTDSRKEQIKDLELIEKSLKALDIIVNKEIDIWWLLKSDTVEHHNYPYVFEGYKKLTEEEFELLKEVLL